MKVALVAQAAGVPAVPNVPLNATPLSCVAHYRRRCICRPDWQSGCGRIGDPDVVGLAIRVWSD